MGLKTYSAKQLTLIFGPVTIEGFADGTFAVASRHNPTANTVVGSDGEGARAMSSDRSGVITVTLLQTSKSNDELSELADFDERTGQGVFPFLLKDASGRTVCQSETAYIEKPADGEFGREISNREWSFQTDDLGMFIGGN